LADPIRRQPEDLQIDVLRLAAEQPVAHPAADDDGASARVAHRRRDRGREIEAHRSGLRPNRWTRRSVSAGANAFSHTSARDFACGNTSATGRSIARAIALATTLTSWRGPWARVTIVPVSRDMTSKNSVSVETGYTTVT